MFTYCCLVLPIICIALVLRLGHATGGTHVLIWTSWGLWQRLVVTWAEFQHSMVYYATDQCRKKTGSILTQKVVTQNTRCDIACLTFQFPHITTGSFQSHQRQPTSGSLESLQCLIECNKYSVRLKSFAIIKLVWWHFQVGWACAIQFIFFWDNINNQNCVWIKNDFFGFPKVKWLHLTGEVNKSVTYHVKFSHDLTR